MDSNDEVINWEEALAHVQGDRELLEEMAKLFLEVCPGLLSAIHEAIARHDARGLEHAAHDLKSSVGNFGARAAQEAALTLEKIGREGNLVRAEENYRLLEESVRQLSPVLEALARSKKTS